MPGYSDGGYSRERQLSPGYVGDEPSEPPQCKESQLSPGYVGDEPSEPPQCKERQLSPVNAGESGGNEEEMPTSTIRKDETEELSPHQDQDQDQDETEELSPHQDHPWHGPCETPPPRTPPIVGTLLSKLMPEAPISYKAMEDSYPDTSHIVPNHESKPDHNRRRHPTPRPL